MAKIAYVKAWGLWSHLETTFDFSPSLTVITGPNGNGKSTLIRIIKWVALGEPSGEDFIFQITDEVTGAVIKEATEGKAEIGLDNGIVITKTRRKGKTTYTINTVPEPFEKAEVPQEVKDALGIKKYSFGDFSTYLSFAFQMEAPFLISETPSTGAKVLGKLAGTEIVDLAIADTSKKTHKARDEQRTAEKDIERVNGDLLSYNDLDSIREQLDACEYLMSDIDTLVIRSRNLKTLKDTLERDNFTIATLTSELTAFGVVPELQETLKETEKNHQHLTALVELRNSFETCDNTIMRLSKELEQYAQLNEATKLLTQIEATERKLSNLTILSTNYQHYTQITQNCKEVLEKLEGIDVAASDLANIEKRYARIATLKEIYGAYVTTSATVNNTAQELMKYKELGTAAELLETVEQLNKRLLHLKDLQTQCANKTILVTGYETDVILATAELDKAKAEVQAAWDAAGGICPLCEQPVNSHTH